MLCVRSLSVQVRKRYPGPLLLLVPGESQPREEAIAEQLPQFIREVRQGNGSWKGRASSGDALVADTFDVEH